MKGRLQGCRPCKPLKSFHVFFRHSAVYQRGIAFSKGI